MTDGKMWTQRDRFGNDIYPTHERWQHIIDPDNHPELSPHLDHVRETIRHGRRRQDPYDPQSFKYYAAFPGLPDDNTHVRRLCPVPMDYRARRHDARRKVRDNGLCAVFLKGDDGKDKL